MLEFGNFNIPLLGGHLPFTSKYQSNCGCPQRIRFIVHVFVRLGRLNSLCGSGGSSSSIVLFRPLACGGFRGRPFPFGDDLNLMLIFLRTCWELEPARPSPSIPRSVNGTEIFFTSERSCQFWENFIKYEPNSH